MVHRSTELPDFEEFSEAYDNYFTELLPKFRNNGEKPEERVIKLGEAVWDKLFEVYGVKPVFERKR